MKKLIIAIVVLLSIFVVWKLVSKDKLSVKTNPDSPEVEQTSGAQGKYTAPSATDSRTYTIDPKSSSIGIIGASDKNASKLDIKSGSIVLDKGAIIGGDATFSVSGLKGSEEFAGLSTADYGEAKLTIKALVFDKAGSSIEQLVYRTDTELTMNGVTMPVSFVSKYIYGNGTIMISGNATPDWKLWNITSANTDMKLNIVLNATAK